MTTTPTTDPAQVRIDDRAQRDAELIGGIAYYAGRPDAGTPAERLTKIQELLVESGHDIETIRRRSDEILGRA